ncbi:MAG: hypothetical protein EOP85_03410 [Verrucomicrobiaceae bacterium]|nr:MAG: hypothetical protein EOP85_03410 [Verrucomicrobiaceae bacterium]
MTHAAEIRTWTDVQNRKIEASLVRVDGDSIVLKLKDGREVPLPISRLSEADKKHVAEAKIIDGGSSPKTPEADKPADALNFGDPWPERIKFTEDPEINTVEEDADKKRFIYESANYRYVCDVRLAKSVVKGFAVMFEATHLFCRTMPLGVNGGKGKDGKHQILLFEKFDDYVKAGGPPSSAGVFMGGRGVVMVPLGSLGVKQVGSGYMLDRDKSSKTLPHELTHQLTPDVYYQKGPLGWFSEGIAEYVAVTPYRAGSYAVRGNQKDIFDYATGYGSKDMGGRALGTKIDLPPLKSFMLQSYAEFLDQPQLSYGCGLLITTYFLHMDGEGDGKRIKAFLKALHEGMDGEKALDLLLDGRTFKQLEEDLTKAWSRKGVDFKFAK